MTGLKKFSILVGTAAVVFAVGFGTSAPVTSAVGGGNDEPTSSNGNDGAAAAHTVES